jgi:hypothetical protein
MTYEEWCDVKTWKLALLIGGLTAVAVFGVAAVAFGGGYERGMPFGGQGGGMMVAADGDDATRDGGRGCGGFGLLDDPQAREDVLALREEHRDEMAAWWEKFGEDPQAAAAQEALEQLREEHRADMLALFDKYGVTPPEGFGERGGCGMGGGPGAGCGGPETSGYGAEPGGSGCGGGSGMMGGQGWGADTL